MSAMGERSAGEGTRSSQPAGVGQSSWEKRPFSAYDVGVATKFVMAVCTNWSANSLELEFKITEIT